MTLIQQINQVHLGNNLELLDLLPDHSVDVIITDPPYGLNLLGKHTKWDKVLPDPATWVKCLRVLKPGGYIAVFAFTRLYHRIAIHIEDSGLEMRDMFGWIYGEAMPKSMNMDIEVSKRFPEFKGKYVGLGTGLRPSIEPIAIARAPLDGTVVNTLLTHGTGAMNIQACKLHGEDMDRYPPNLAFDEYSIDFLNYQVGRDVSAYFYHPKVGKVERDAGLDDFPWIEPTAINGRKEGSAGINNPRAGVRSGRRKNPHPCLHPDALVLTERGYRPIGTIQECDKVYAADGTFRRVTHVSRHPYTSPNLFHIHVRGLNETTLASDNHPFLIWRPTRVRKAIKGGTVMWLRADEIQRGDYTMTPVLREGPTDEAQIQDPEFWFLFGLYLAEGVLQTAGHGTNVYPSYSLHENETNLIQRIKHFFGEDKVSVYAKPDTKGVQVMAFNPEVGKLFLTLGGKLASDKQLSPSVWVLPQVCKTAILEGWLAGDGGRVRTHLQGKTVSSDLAAQLHLLADSAGYHTRVYKSMPGKPTVIRGRTIKGKYPVYQLDLSEGKPGYGPTKIQHGETTYSLRYVTKVEHVPYIGDVVNLSVDGVPTFQTAVGMSHNTVKPIALMRWLVRLLTPPGGVVLDPFAGSGSTGCAAVLEGQPFIGFDLDPQFVPIANARIRYWASKKAELPADTLEVAVEEEADLDLPPLDLP